MSIQASNAANQTIIFDHGDLQQRIDQAAVDKRSKIKLQAGKYILETGLIIHSPIKLVGSSIGRTTIKLADRSDLHQSVILVGKMPPKEKCWQFNELVFWNSTSLSGVVIEDIDIEGNRGMTGVDADNLYPHHDQASMRRICDLKDVDGYKDQQQATEWDYRFDDIDNIADGIRWCRGIKANGITIWNADNVRIERCRISQARSGGIVAQTGCTNIHINQCLIENNFIDGIAPDSVRSINIQKCVFRNNKDAGFSWSFGAGVEKFPNLVHHVTITDCLFEGNKTGFWANNIHNVNLSGCSFINNEIVQISIDQDLESRGSHNVHIHTCIFSLSKPSMKNVNWCRVPKPYFRESNNFIVGYSFEGATSFDANHGQNCGYEIRNDDHYASPFLYSNALESLIFWK